MGTVKAQGNKLRHEMKPPEISFKRFTQKKKERPPEQQEDAAERSENSGAATDSEDGIKSNAEKGNDVRTRIQQVSNENAIVITQVQESKKMKKIDVLADVVVQDKLEVPTINSRKLAAPAKLPQRKNDTVSSDDEADGDADDEEEDEDEAESQDEEDSVSFSDESLDLGSSDEPEISDDDDDDENGNESDENESDEDEQDEDEEEEEEQEDDDFSECSLNESDLERLVKKPKKKRKHVLTLQRWRGYKKKRRLAKQENPDGTPVVAVKRKKKARKLPVDELTRRRQVVAAELKRKLKESIANPKKKKKKKKTVPVESIVEERSPPKAAAVPAVAAVAALPALPAPEAEVPASPEPEQQPSPILAIMPATNLSTSESKPSPFDRGIKLRGRKLRKRFNGRVFRGEVADYDRRNRHYKVRYEDGDEEQLMWKDLGPLLVPFEELHTWDDPNYQPQQKRVISAELLEVEKKAKEEKLKLPKLKPQVVKKR